MQTVEMLKQDDCPLCDAAKATLTAHGVHVVEIPVSTLDQRQDRHDIMAELQLVNGKIPIMRLAGCERWFTSVEEMLIEIQRSRGGASMGF
jgi:glutaredoxin